MGWGNRRKLECARKVGPAPGMPGGRERTEPEWHKLMNKAGFEITRIVPMKAPESVIEVKLKA